MGWRRPEFGCYATKNEVGEIEGYELRCRGKFGWGFYVIRMRFGFKISRIAAEACTANN
jgi:hypothetical protein